MNMLAQIESSAVPAIPEQVCYEAYWRDRSVFISAPCQSALEWQWHSLASAILLERLEDACALAEAMLDTSLQFFVSELPAQCTRETCAQEYLHMVFTRADDEVDIWLPARAHTQVAQHDDLINAENLRWESVQAHVLLAQFALSEDDIKRLSKGSLLLIPESWQKTWLCSVEIPQLDFSVNASLDPTTQSLIINREHNSKDKVASSDSFTLETNCSEDASAGNSAPEQLVRVYLDKAVELNPGQLMGGASETQKQAMGIDAVTVRMAQANCNCMLNEHRFKADLLPVGDGYGLSVTEY